MSDEKLQSLQFTDFRTYAELPLKTIDLLPYGVCLSDYSWVCLFANLSSRDVYGPLSRAFAGTNVMDLFQELQYGEVFSRVKYAVEKRKLLEVIHSSPMRDKVTKINGYPLDDCYCFTTRPVPGKNDVLTDLKNFLKGKRK